MAEKLVIRHLVHASAAMVPNRGDLVVTEMQHVQGENESIYYFWSLLEMAKANIEFQFSATVGVHINIDGNEEVLNPYYDEGELVWIDGTKAYRADPDRTISVLPRPKEAEGL